MRGQRLRDRGLRMVKTENKNNNIPLSISGRNNGVFRGRIDDYRRTQKNS